MNTTMIVIACVLGLVALVAWLLGIPPMVGDAILRRFPHDPMRTGDKVHIYIKGKCNRTATITKCSQEYIEIYGAVPCPISYRGGFYAVGTDIKKNRFVYLKNDKYIRLVRAAECVRLVFGVFDDPECLPCDEAAPMDGGEMKPEPESETEDETESEI